jgi:hypothetical protein
MQQQYKCLLPLQQGLNELQKEIRLRFELPVNLHPILIPDLIKRRFDNAVLT